uniref:Uncharacterized protein n=1 Tax=Anguilla anguilla TaxID=7936 RepID=A0A0E9R4C8_ANGAN
MWCHSPETRTIIHNQNKFFQTNFFLLFFLKACLPAKELTPKCCLGVW